MSITLILGGARSGKSARAEVLAQQPGAQENSKPIYIATAPHIAGDAEWQQRIQHHRQQRSEAWLVIEEECQLCDILHKHNNENTNILIDCMTLWLSNLTFHQKDMMRETTDLCATLSSFKGHVVLVSNELGMGLVPETAENRLFRDAQGRLNQQLANIADHVEFIIAGIPMPIKGNKT